MRWCALCGVSKNVLIFEATLTDGGIRLNMRLKSTSAVTC